MNAQKKYCQNNTLISKTLLISKFLQKVVDTFGKRWYDIPI